MLALDGLALVLFVLDAWRLRGIALELSREAPRTAGLSTPFAREVVVPASPTRAGLRVELHEDFPAAFEVLARTADGAEVEPETADPSGGPDVGVLDGAPLVLRRTYRAGLRGVHRLGDLRLLVRGRLGLVWRATRYRGAQDIAVEPALTGLRRTLALAASERWQDLGVRRLRRRGGLTEFESLRDYVQGDEVRQIDWKAFARRGKPTVRQHQEERGQELVILVDGGRRMRATAEGAGVRGWTKLDWALDAALQLAAVALQAGDRVGIAVFDERMRGWVGAGRGARQLARLREAVFGELPSERDSDLARALREVAARHRRRATVLVLSDVADPLSVDRQHAALASASRRHRLIFACLDDPEVRRWADGELPADAPSPGALRAAALDLTEDRRRALRALASSGARVLDALPAEGAGPFLAAWLDERRSFRGAGDGPARAPARRG